METYAKMNRMIVGILRVSESPPSLYAAQRIEELAAEQTHLNDEIEQLRPQAARMAAIDAIVGNAGCQGVHGTGHVTLFVRTSDNVRDLCALFWGCVEHEAKRSHGSLSSIKRKEPT